MTRWLWGDRTKGQAAGHRRGNEGEVIPEEAWGLLTDDPTEALRPRLTEWKRVAEERR